ncbi:MAG: 30S ribosomal protein S5 [Bacteroidia bacterium]|nr:30S ribosomal protein S5 [Bacteroidia bacterium]MDW8089670.1 30S ribosomal protein S5 [Bacteroidia bacterium]
MAKRVVVREAGSALEDRLVWLNRTAKVVKGGRRFGFAALVVVGDRKGIVGFGLGKAAEANVAIDKGIEAAKKNLYRIPLRRTTIPHAVSVKYEATRLILRPAAPGTGLIAGGAVRAVLEVLGVQDVLAKVIGSSNPHNVVRATMKALLQLEDAVSVAERRGISLQKVFRGTHESTHTSSDNAGAQ